MIRMPTDASVPRGKLAPPRIVPILGGPECNDFNVWSEEEQSIIDEATSRDIAEDAMGFDPFD